MGAPQRGIKNRKAGRTGIIVGTGGAIAYDLTRGRNITGQSLGRAATVTSQALGGMRKLGSQIATNLKHAYGVGRGTVKLLPANAGTGKPPFSKDQVKKALKKTAKYAAKKTGQAAVLSGPAKHPAVIGTIAAGSTVYDLYNFVKKKK